MIGTKSTDKNYTRLDLSYISTPNIYYSISAFNNGNGILIGTGDLIGAPLGGTGEEICASKCNGKSYAWQLSYMTGVNNGPGKMRLMSTSEYSNPTTGVVTPFWQAVDNGVYEQMELIYHPYTRTTSNGFQYTQKIITEAMITLNGGPYFDKNNNPVFAGGKLIEKKMDQYTYMGGSVTTADPGYNYCSFETNAWINFYNLYKDPTTMGQPNGDYTFFAPNLPTQLSCNGSGSFGGTGTSGTSVIHDWHEIVEDWFDCVWENYETSSGNNDYLTPCNTILSLATGSPFTGFEFEQINNPADNPSGSLVVAVNNDGSSKVLSKVGQINTGLYNVYVYTSTGKMLSSVYEIPEKQMIKKHRDFVKLEIAPNKIENDVLKFKISSEKDLPVTITAHKLNGQVIHTENTTLSKIIDLQREIAVGNGSSPYNQIRVTLLFEDGSTIQQTALK